MKKSLLIIGIFLLGAYSWYRLQLRPLDASSDSVQVVTISKGSSVGGIAELLREKELIRSAQAFGLRARRRGLQQDLQAGSFLLSPSMHVDTVLDVLTGGKPVQLSITIPEGFTVSDIDRLVAGKGLAESGAILACAQTCDFASFEFLPRAQNLAKRGGKLEGYLYPDTYFVNAGEFVPKFFLERLLTTFRHRIVKDLAADLQVSKRSLHDIVTMASLIEEETRTAEEKPVVAGILWKRSGASMGLGVDAAVRYILEKPTSAITLEDLNIDSPYNLRRFRGLPPGPIASPGLSSIKAALHPKGSPYWYYLHDAEGRIHYAVTNEEHNVNKAKYLR